METMSTTESQKPRAVQAAVTGNGERFLRLALPLATMFAWLAAWEFYVWQQAVPPYILPAPSLILQTLVENFSSLESSLWFTLRLTLMALALAVLSGALIGTVFALSPLIELSFFPFAIMLQVTPIIAIAPLIMIYVDSTFAALLICAWIVAFFPMLSNTVIGLRSADHNLKALFRLYRATPWQTFRYLLAPSALPFFMAGLKIAGGLALIGAVVAEFVAGASGRDTGLASRILEASFRNEIPRMFSSLVLVSMCGMAIFMINIWLSKRLLGYWHESEIKSES
ncbi:ABC transporter permease [Aminobacter sp. P9b]|uniref:NitT/TauT family transport system permease protein n=2 Tax=Phyllobacteriaceae TaxID=69277 RepID=A0ABR6L8P1_9HYPH|nr:ABC transporter permease [Aminobacter niigataensis]AWC22512.1 Putative aliphatic sulfonates transport permease protein SsuC [Aminobacter sp. MSH1]MBB4653186.1 NitT/TauT family transport system permease protein [Aminobacter niigataensis]CAI2933123.1 Aliphatic sulfonates transport permease protein SsuC [Aminobacter niigataensis]